MSDLRQILASLLLTFPTFGESQLPPNARVAIIGDSITEQKLYLRFIETYLVGCTGRNDIRCFQFGWSSSLPASTSPPKRTRSWCR